MLNGSAYTDIAIYIGNKGIFSTWLLMNSNFYKWVIYVFINYVFFNLIE